MCLADTNLRPPKDMSFKDINNQAGEQHMMLTPTDTLRLLSNNGQWYQEHKDVYPHQVQLDDQDIPIKTAADDYRCTIIVDVLAWTCS